MKKLATLVIALALIPVLAGCGKTSKGTAPTPSSSSAPQTRQDALPIAQESAAMATSYVAQVRSLIGVATVPGSKPARLRPLHAQAAGADSSSWTYTFQGYDASGAPIDYLTQPDQLASLAIDWQWYFRSASDSMTVEDDYHSHSKVDGFLATATRFVANATDTARVAIDEISSNYHIVGYYDGRSTMTNLAWEKSGTPTYPVAGSISLHWHWVYDQTYNGQHYAGNWLIDGTIIFNGTRYATAVIGNYTFTIDLESGAVS